MSKKVLSKVCSVQLYSGTDRLYFKKDMGHCKLETSEVSVKCPTGIVKLVACAEGMHELTLAQPYSEISSHMSCEKVSADKDTSMASRSLNDCVEWLVAYFQRDMSALIEHRPRLCSNIFNHNTFRSKVWCTLEKEVGFGSTISYGGLASLCGSPKASQAVGSAMRNNPLSLVVPCHRVILSSGKSGNYAGGKMNDVKVWLLRHEKLSTLQIPH